MALGRALGSFLQPIAPGLPGSVNPLTFIGAGMASGDIGRSMAQMANLQQAQQQIGMQQQQMDILRQQQARKAAAAQQAAQQRALMQQVALGMLPKRPVEAAGPPTAEGETPTAMRNTPEQLVMAMAMHDAVAKAALNPLPIEGGKGGFFNPLTGEIMGAPAAGPGGPRGMTREEFLSEYNASDFANFAEVFRQGEMTGRYDPAQLQRRIKPEEFRGMRADAEKRLKPIEDAVMKSNQVLSSLQQATGVGDITATIGMMKILDPTSVVSGAEREVVEQAGGLYNNILGMLRNAKGKGSLSPQVRAEIYDNVMSLLSIYQSEDVRLRSDIEAQAGAMGFQPSMFTPSPFRYPTEETFPRPLTGNEPPPNMPPPPDPALVEEGLRRFGVPPSMGQRYGQP